MKYRFALSVLTAFCSACAFAAPRLAFQTYAVRDLCEKDFAGTLKAVKAMGFEGVETGRFYGLDAKGLKAACDEAGLELVALQLYPHCLTEPQLAETIKFCKGSGAKRINVAWYKGSAENANDWQLLVNVLNHAAAVCAKVEVIGSHQGVANDFNLNDSTYRANDWGRTDPDDSNSTMPWLHSDIKNMAYYHVYPAFANIAEKGAMKYGEIMRTCRCIPASVEKLWYNIRRKNERSV